MSVVSVCEQIVTCVHVLITTIPTSGDAKLVPLA